jgi:hypothetical protein
MRIVSGTSTAEIPQRYLIWMCRPLYVQCDLDESENEDDSKVYVKIGTSTLHSVDRTNEGSDEIGLFPPKSTSKPTHHLFVKDMEEWEKPVDGARLLETQ